MKLDVWVTIGKPSESIFCETRSVGIDLPTDGKDDLRTIVFELPTGTRLDGRGPIRVMLEPRPETSRVGKQKGALWGPDLMMSLREKGLIPNMVQRVIIDCPHDGFAKIHIEGGLDNEKSLDLLPAMVLGAGVLDSAEPARPEPATVGPDEIPF